MREPDRDAVVAAADRAAARAGHSGPPSRGRGRLSTLDQLPDEAGEDVVWAVAQLNARKLTQDEIRFEFNDRLAKKGIDEISRSAFNRSSMKLAAMSSRLNEARQLFEGLAPEFTAEKVDQNTLVLGEFIKLLVFELTQNDGNAIGPKGAMELAKAHLAVIQGQRISSDRRAMLETKFKAEAVKAIDRVAETKGLTTDVVTSMKAQIFGQALPASAGVPGGT